MDNFWKDKKVIAFVALLHHTRFIIPVMEKLEELGAHVQYVVAQAERSQEITAVECRMNYTHVFEYLGPEDFNDIQENYLRERRVLGRSLTTDFALAAQMITVTDKTLYACAQEYVGFKNLIKKERPDICLALHELNRWGKVFSFWAKKFNTPFITLQEGLGYNESFGYIGHVQNSTLGLVWGERIKKKFSDYEAPVERIIPVGNTHISKEKEHQENHNIRAVMRARHDLEKYFVPLLLFSAHPCEKEKLFPLLDQVARQPGLKLIIKFHPACKTPVVESWKASIPANLKKKILFVHTHENTYDLMSASDLCVLAEPSTTGIESIALEKPLVELDLDSKVPAPYSFAEQKVALKMTPEELAAVLKGTPDFSSRFDPKDIDLFLKNELTDTTGATDRIVVIMKKVIGAGREKAITPLVSGKAMQFDWTFIIPVPASAPKDFLFELQTISETCQELDSFEVLLVEPPDMSPEILTVLNSLEGDVVRLQADPGSNFFETVNQKGLKEAGGKTLVIFSELLFPFPQWITHLKTGMATWGENKIFGAKIINKFKNIVHAGMVLDANHSPVSAYRHLSFDFPEANRERPFQMLDGFIALSRNFFANLGGFSPEAGPYAFMDICLKAFEQTKDWNTCVFLPQCTLLQDYTRPPLSPDQAIEFFGRWHGTLWDSETRLYEADGISPTRLDEARMARAQEMAKTA